jgi:subtilisin family serine protease
MRKTITYLFAMVLVPALASAEPSYINSRGDLVELDPAPKEAAAEFVRAGLITPAGAVFEVPGMPRQILLDRGLIVKLREGVTIPPAKLLASAGLTPVRWIGPPGAMLLCEASDAAAALSASKAAAEMPEVEWAVPDFTFPVELAHRPDDPYYVEQWYHYQPSGAHINSEEAWDVTLGDPQVIVAVFDTGQDTTHPDFAPERLLTGYNAIDQSTDVTPGPDAFDGHGTACAGLAVATGDNREGVVGVCPQCSLLPIKFRGNYGDITGAAEAYYHALNRGVWVTSNSWAVLQEYTGSVDLAPVRQAIQDFVAQAREGNGGAALFASTNEGRAIGFNELANMPEVMAIGGTDIRDQVVSYSNFGPNLSVVAPTGAPNFNIPQIITTDVQGNGGFSRDGFFWSWSQVGGDFNTGWPEPDTTGNYTRYANGTSASTPIAAGVVALAFSVNPDLTGAEAREIVEKTADKVGGVTYDESRDHNIYYGYGRVNAARAVRAAQFGFRNPPSAQCAENFNCSSDICKKIADSDPYGECWLDCTPLPDGTMCSDVDECTQNDACSNGVCTGAQISCDDNNPCTDDFCDPAEGCIYVNSQIPCDDQNACTENDTCKEGTCTGIPIHCNDYNPCTDDTCDPATGCTYTNNQSFCEDGDACTEGDKCKQGQCTSGSNECEGCGCGKQPGSLSLLLLFAIALLALTRRR